MINPKIIRNNITLIEDNIAKRQYQFDLKQLKQLESQRKALQLETEKLQHDRHQLSQQFGQYKRENRDIAELKQQIDAIKQQLENSKQQFNTVKDKLDQLASELPNLLADDVPFGSGEDDNQQIDQFGSIPNFDFTVADHVTIGETMGLGLANAAKLSGARFMTLSAQLAKLQRVLTQFMLNVHIEAGYTEVYVPYIVGEHCLYGTGQFPKFKEDVYRLDNDQKHYLIPTAEVPVTNLLRESIVAESDLPIKYVCHTPCFRSEAGSYGKDMHGLIRQHQFEKVELVQFVIPEHSEQAHEQLTRDAERVLQLLELPYRKVLLCSADTGFSATKTYDLEVWVPSQNCYREISSCSNFTDFQARRMQARFRDANQNVQLLHTLNGSGLAVGRTLLAILENYQQADGSVVVPSVLRSAFGSDLIKPIL